MALSFKKRTPKSGTEVRAGKVPPKGKVFKASRGSKFVLFVGDEGAILVYLKDNVVQSRQFVPDASQANLEELKQTFVKDIKAPVMMVVDSMDQSYVQQTLPPVSSMSVGKLIKRRLERDFGKDDIKGAVMLGREKTGRKDWNFLMIALERSPQMTVWLDFVAELPNRFRGIHLISVEAESIVKTLETALGIPKEGTGAEWKFFVSHNKVGGFRQVILRNGRIIFTRLAQPLAEANTEVIAGSIEQEMLSTIEYMKRMSYNPATGLDIYIVASAGIKESIDTRKFNATSAQIFTPFEIAQFFNIEGATQPSDQFGDVVLAAIIGCTRKFILTLTAPQYQKIDTFYNLTFYQRIFATLAFLGMVGYSGYTGFDIMMLASNISDLERKKTTEQNTLTALRKEIARTDLDVEKATDLIDLYKQISKETITPLSFIEKIQPLITSPITLKSIDWTMVDAKGAAAANAATPPAPPPDPAAAAAAAIGNPAASFNPATGYQMQAVLTFELPPIANNEKARRLIENKVVTDFQKVFSGYNIAFDTKAKVVVQAAGGEKEYSDTKTEPTPNLSKATSDKPVESKMTIKGPYPLILTTPAPVVPAPNAAAPEGAQGGAKP